MEPVPVFSFRALIEKRSWARAYQPLVDAGLGFLSGLRLKLSRSFGVLGFFSVILPIIPIWTVSLQPQWMREGKVGWQWCLSVRFKSLDHRHPTWTQQFLCQNDKNCLTSENLKIESKEKARSGAELLASPTPSRRRLTDGKTLPVFPGWKQLSRQERKTVGKVGIQFCATRFIAFNDK